MEASGVFTLRNLEDTDRIAEAMPSATRAVIVGGGYVGLETAEQFRRKGLDVALVEMQSQVMPFLDDEMVEPLHRQLEYNGVRLELGNAIASIEEREGGRDRGRARRRHTAAGRPHPVGGRGAPQHRPCPGSRAGAGGGGGIVTDAHMLTSDPDIYAVGDAAEYTFDATGTKMRVPARRSRQSQWPPGG